ncbi:galactose ABC transporter substrate-binding protein [Conchiformibius kuhniae]|uniref:D-galactose/methyl-galactoside binding periplasmic protein MglB n=1 Tax=Conchiformibius kuhniae TaxID=211502 RepID=A0A8T9MY80_9NEIS|nr:galactose ABC transporter substrate-binding protein [Conchiformibius kuhniae]
MNGHKNPLHYFAGVCAVLAAAGCGGGPHADNRDTGSPFPAAVVGASVSSIESNPFFKGMYQSLEETAKQQPNLTLMLDSARNNQALQNTQLDGMLDKQAKALVVNLAEVAQGPVFLQTMCKRKIPVVYIDHHPGKRPLASCPQAYMVEGDSVQAGILQGRQVLKGWKANPKWDKNGDGVIQYAMLEGTPGHEGAMARTKWSVGTMEHYPKLGVPVQKLFQETAMFNFQKAEEVVGEWVKSPAFAGVEVLLANNDSMALGAINVLKENNISLPVFGIDGSEPALRAMQAGHLTATVFNDYREQARTALRMGANLAAGKDASAGIGHNMEYRVVKIPYQEIDADNIAQFLPQ